MSKKKQMVAALREAADLIEAADLPDDCNLSARIGIYPHPNKETRTGLKQVLRGFPKSKFNTYQGSAWADYRLPADDAKITVFFSRRLMERQ